MRISLIVAMARNRVIGDDGRLPWRLPADLKRFKSITMGCPLIMGRKTHDSIGRPLPGRANIILTRDAAYTAPGCVVVHSVSDALSQADLAAELFVIGGASVYAEFLPCADTIHITLIHRDFPGDVYFPEIDPACWRVSAREDIDDDPSFPHPYSFMRFDRSIGQAEQALRLHPRKGQP